MAGPPCSLNIWMCLGASLTFVFPAMSVLKPPSVLWMPHVCHNALRSSSVHRRTVSQPEGDEDNLKVRLSNLIAENMAPRLKIRATLP